MVLEMLEVGKFQLEVNVIQFPLKELIYYENKLRRKRRKNILQKQ
jgi:hypothetical protein